MQAKRTITAFFCVFVVLMLPHSSAYSSGINFLDATVSDKINARTNSVSLNQNQTLIASAYGSYVDLHNATSLDLVERFDFGRQVYHIEFSPDGKYLAINLAAEEAVPNSIRIIEIDNLEKLSAQGKGNNRPGNLDYSPDGTKIIAPNMNNGAQIINSVTLSEIVRLEGVHTSDVTCTKFSKTGSYVITGDENGKVQLWNSDGDELDVQIDLGEEITGCDFSDLDVKFAISTKSGNIYSYSITGSELQSKDLGESQGIEWSDDADILYTLESDSSPAVIALDGSTFEIIHLTHLVHQAPDFAIVEENGILKEIYVATDTNHIAIYGAPQYPEGYGMMGSDLDGDNIPDTFDNDDDGDSFEDDYDFNCLNSTICSRDPDLNNIRSMSVEILGNTLVVEDIYTMSQSDTYLLRNLTRRGVIADQRISYEETNMLENAFCSNMDQNDYVQELRNSIELSVGQANNGTLQCKIIAGLSFTKTYDKEQIKFVLSTSFDVAPNVTLPLSISLNSQISVSESSITHKMENHPILLQQIKFDNEVVASLWWNSEMVDDPMLNFTGPEISESNINHIVDILSNNVLTVILVSVSAILGIWLIIRRRNLNSVILNQNEFENEEINTEMYISPEIDEFEVVETNNDYNQVQEDETFSIDYEEEVFATGIIPSDEKPIDRRAFTLDEEVSDETVEVKRRTGRIQRNAQGPIMSTKRKRLDGKLDVPGQQIVSKKKIASKVKTRKVANKVKVRKVRSVKKDD